MNLDRTLLLLAMCLAPCASPAWADRTWSNADLQGSYSLGITQTPGPNASFSGAEWRLGVLSFDGDGHVVGGSRLVMHAQDDLRGHGYTVRDEQSIVNGTYSIGPDGRGTIQLTWTPMTLPYAVLGNPHMPGEECTVTADPGETMDVTLTPGRFSYMATIACEYTPGCARGARSELYMLGEATSQEGPNSPALAPPQRVPPPPQRRFAR